MNINTIQGKLCMLPEYGSTELSLSQSLSQEQMRQ